MTLNMDDLTGTEFRETGFEGERAVVLPRPVAAQAAKHPLLRGLRVTDAGYYPRAARHGIERPRGASGAVLILCREGSGWVRLDRGPRRAVGPGDAVLLAPGRAHAYGADREKPWTIQWTHFEGAEIPEWWRLLGLPPEGGVLRLCAGIPEELDLGRVHERLGYDLPALLAAAGALRWALANLRAAPSAAEAGEPSRRAVEKVEEWMREHLAGGTTLARLARKASLSPSHFSALFRERFGFAPMDYFHRLKIRRACHLLDATPWPVGRVAEEIGIADPLYFSRRFRLVMGQSPRDYRDQSRGPQKSGRTGLT